MSTLIIVMGLPGVGKSTVGKIISKKMNVVFFDTDDIKHKLVPKLLGKEVYKERIKKQLIHPYHVRKRVYEQMCIEVEKLLKENKDVIVEATFYTKELRGMVYKLAKFLKAKLYIVEVVCPDKIVKKRIVKRFRETGHPARIGIYEGIKNIWEPIEEEHFVIDTGKDIDEQVDKFLKQIN